MSGKSGYDVQFMWNGVPVGQLRDITGPALRQDAIDVTTRDDQDIDQFLGGMKDGGEATLEMVYDPDLATQTTLRTAQDAASVGMGEFQVGTGAKPSGMRFFALVTGFQPKAPMKDALTADVSVKLTHAAAQIDYLVTHAGDQLVTAAGKFLIA